MKPQNNTQNNPRKPTSTPPVREGGRGKGSDEVRENQEVLKVVTVYRLEKNVYDALEKQIGNIRITDRTTETEYAYQLGIQKALQVIREGLVLE